MCNESNNKPVNNQEEFQRVIEKITDYVGELYDIMPPGMTIDITIPIKPEVIIPNQKIKTKRIYITRPSLITYITAH